MRNEYIDPLSAGPVRIQDPRIRNTWGRRMFDSDALTSNELFTDIFFLKGDIALRLASSA